MLKELLGTTDGLLNISSPKLTELMEQLTWNTIQTTASFYLINYALVEYGDPDVWYLIARRNNITDGIAPANSKLQIPTFGSLAAIATMSKNDANSTLGTEVMI